MAGMAMTMRKSTREFTSTSNMNAINVVSNMTKTEQYTMRISGMIAEGNIVDFIQIQ
jgi:hypothetical protein